MTNKFTDTGSPDTQSGNSWERLANELNDFRRAQHIEGVVPKTSIAIPLDDFQKPILPSLQIIDEL